jgi:hypothetical protein
MVSLLKDFPNTHFGTSILPSSCTNLHEPFDDGNIEVPKCVLGKSFNKETIDKLVLVHLLV